MLYHDSFCDTIWVSTFFFSFFYTFFRVWYFTKFWWYFFCARYQRPTKAVFWPEFTISWVSKKTEVLPETLNFHNSNISIIIMDYYRHLKGKFPNNVVKKLRWGKWNRILLVWESKFNIYIWTCLHCGVCGDYKWHWSQKLWKFILLFW